MRRNLQRHDARIADPQPPRAVDPEAAVDDAAVGSGGGAADGAGADGVPVRDCGGADPGGEIFGGGCGAAVGGGGGGGVSGTVWCAGGGGVYALEDDVAEGFGAADFVGEGLAGDHEFEVDFPAWAGVVLGVDEGFVVGGCGGGGSGGGGGDVDGAAGEGVLQHLQHGGVFFAGEGLEVGVVVADVEVEFDLPEWGWRGEAVGEDFVVRSVGGGLRLGMEGGCEGRELVLRDEVREGEVGHRRGDCGARTGLMLGVFFICGCS